MRQSTNTIMHPDVAVWEVIPFDRDSVDVRAGYPGYQEACQEHLRMTIIETYTRFLHLDFDLQILIVSLCFPRKTNDNIHRFSDRLKVRLQVVRQEHFSRICIGEAYLAARFHFTMEDEGV